MPADDSESLFAAPGLQAGMAQLIDHLWLSILLVALAWCLAWLTRRNSAALRLWMWRIAAFKFLLPFSLLYAAGGWLGFPVRHSAVAPPAALAEAAAAALQLASPAQALALAYLPLTGWLLLAVLAASLCALLIWRELCAEGRQLREQRAAAESQQAAPLGFFKTITLGGVVLFVVSGTLVTGALHD